MNNLSHGKLAVALGLTLLGAACAAPADPSEGQASDALSNTAAASGIRFFTSGPWLGNCFEPSSPAQDPLLDLDIDAYDPAADPDWSEVKTWWLQNGGFPLLGKLRSVSPQVTLGGDGAVLDDGQVYKTYQFERYILQVKPQNLGTPYHLQGMLLGSISFDSTLGTMAAAPGRYAMIPSSPLMIAMPGFRAAFANSLSSVGNFVGQTSFDQAYYERMRVEYHGDAPPVRRIYDAFTPHGRDCTWQLQLGLLGNELVAELNAISRARAKKGTKERGEACAGHAECASLNCSAQLGVCVEDCGNDPNGNPIDPGWCTCQTHADRQDDVTSQCKPKAADCKPQDSCDDLTRKAARHLACATARTLINNGCYAGATGDSAKNHVAEADSEYVSYSACVGLEAAERCSAGSH